MPHKWKRKHPAKSTPANSVILQAVNMVCEERKSIREVAKAMNLSKSALARHLKKINGASDKESVVFQSNLTCGMVFSEEEEAKLRHYLLTASKMHYGLTTVQVRNLAYEFAAALDKKYPNSWDLNKIAGYDWFKGFMGRHPQLSLRSPEATSLGRATSFNKKNVDDFLGNLKSLYEKYKLTPDSVYNCDETGVSTVNTPPRVIAARGEKQVGQVTSAERGEQVTVLCTVNAIGNSVPPVFIYPRVRYKDFFLKGTPPGSLALASRSGWMTAELFVQCLEHIIKTTKCSKEKPILLLLDNHESHINLKVIDTACKNGVIMLTFPPHCSHRLQPLDVSVYSALKSHYNRVCNDWLVNNPGKTISIYVIGELVGLAYPLAVTQKNIISGFQKTGIHPFNSQPFTEEEYLMSSVTDRPDPSPSISYPATIIQDNVSEQGSSSSSHNPELDPSELYNPAILSTPSKAANKQITEMTSSVKSITPEDIRPFPKAGPRKESNRGRRKGRTRILTSTPEKAEAEREASEKLKKKALQNKKAVLFAAKKKITLESSESSSEEIAIPIQDSDDDMSISSSLSDVCLEEINWKENSVRIDKGDFVLVKFCTKKSVVYYAGKIHNADNDDFEVQFMRNKWGCKFFFPEQDDISYVDKHDIVLKLPTPIVNKGTERVKSMFSFEINLSTYNIQ